MMNAQSQVNRHVEVVFGKPFNKTAIGYDGENLASSVTMDCGLVAERHPDAQYTLLFSRSQELPYIAVPTMAADAEHRLHYTLTSAETAVPGPLRMEVQAREGEVLLKSFVFYFDILKSLDAPTQPPAPPAPGWATAVLEAAVLAEAAAAAAAQAKTIAVQCADSAALSEQRAKVCRDEAEALLAEVIARAGSELTDDEMEALLT